MQRICKSFAINLVLRSVEKKIFFPVIMQFVFIDIELYHFFSNTYFWNILVSINLLKKYLYFFYDMKLIIVIFIFYEIKIIFW